MTRKEQTKEELNQLFKSYPQVLPSTAFYYGIKWADKHPKLSWKSFKDLTPDNGQKVIIAIRVEGKEEIRYETFNWDDSMKNSLSTFIAWMPILALPKEMKDE